MTDTAEPTPDRSAALSALLAGLAVGEEERAEPALVPTGNKVYAGGKHERLLIMGANVMYRVKDTDPPVYQRAPLGPGDVALLSKEDAERLDAAGATMTPAELEAEQAARDAAREEAAKALEDAARQPADKVEPTETLPPVTPPTGDETGDETGEGDETTDQQPTGEPVTPVDAGKVEPVTLPPVSNDLMTDDAIREAKPAQLIAYIGQYPAERARVRALEEERAASAQRKTILAATEPTPLEDAEVAQRQAEEDARKAAAKGVE